MPGRLLGGARVRGRLQHRRRIHALEEGKTGECSPKCAFYVAAPRWPIPGTPPSSHPRGPPILGLSLARQERYRGLCHMK